MSEFYKLNAQDVISELRSDQEAGLTATDVQHRLEEYGQNELVERGGKNPWRILLEQFTQTMVIILMVAAVISIVLGEFTDATAILVIVVLNGLLGFSQEYRAEQAMEALKKLAVPIVRVRRDGHVDELPAQSLVPGDIVLLEAGNLVPADGRVVESANLSVQESALTGESEPVAKRRGYIPEQGEDVPLAERKNMVYMGTTVTYGRGEIVITETGMNTELGQIAELMQTAEQEPTPLQKRLDQLGKGSGLGCFGAGGDCVLDGAVTEQ